MLISLNDYFAPLLPLGLIYFFIFFLFFDAFGGLVKKLLFKNIKRDDIRIIQWLLGFGFFIFIWFLISLFIPPTRESVGISAISLFIVSLPSYAKDKHVKPLLSNLWSTKPVILLILFFIPAVFVKASLPPYYGDEMAYHFISPSTLAALTATRYTGGLFLNVPRLLNTYFDISFAVTHTYSVARLTQFTILVTSLIYAYQIIKKHFGKWAAILFVFLFLSLPQDIAFTSTLGYVDVAAYSFLLIAVSATVDFLVDKKEEMLLISSAFWAMNLGTKYTGITSFVPYLLVLIAIFVFKRKEYLKLFKLKYIIRLAIIFLIFGGYWYIKNLVVYGNPIYPFFFPCVGRYAIDCKTGNGFFGDWTIQVTARNLLPILQSLLPSNPILQFLAILTPTYILFSKSKYRYIFILLTGAVFGELAILKFFSGFLVRYQQHIQLYLILAVAIYITRKEALRDYVGKGILLALISVATISFVSTVKHTNSLGFVNWNEINYSIGKMNINDWVSFYFPRMKSAISWCENPPSGERTPLARFDPDMIWYEYDGYMRSFLTNCYYDNPPLDGLELDKVLAKAKTEKMQFWIATPNECTTDDKIQTMRGVDDPHMLYLRRLNNLIICNSQEVSPNLYYFDYSKLR